MMKNSLDYINCIRIWQLLTLINDKNQPVD